MDHELGQTAGKIPVDLAEFIDDHKCLGKAQTTNDRPDVEQLVDQYIQPASLFGVAALAHIVESAKAEVLHGGVVNVPEHRKHRRTDEQPVGQIHTDEQGHRYYRKSPAELLIDALVDMTAEYHGA